MSKRGSILSLIIIVLVIAAFGLLAVYGLAIHTSLTTLFTITAVYILGVASIREFTLPLIVGIVSGTCSSIFIAR